MYNKKKYVFVVFVILVFVVSLSCCTPSQKEIFVNNMGMKFVFIPSGSFSMGSPDNELLRKKDEIQHNVVLKKGFYLQTTEVTQQQWQDVMGNNPSFFQDCGSHCPVENISWTDAQQFIQKLNERDTHNTYRLPTEAEWEYACRAGTTTRYSWGDEADCHKANFGNSPLSQECTQSSPGKPSPVGSYQANPWGLYDMHGNVWEWCSDWYGPYPVTRVTDPCGVPHGTHRVVRGGAYFDPGESCRTANRCWDPPNYRVQDIGFRLVRLPLP